jgi:putative peptidoglycan lipid II flippase
VPDLIMLALFGRGAFTAADAAAAGATLAAYAVGLLPFVLMRSATTTFLARGDTITPVIALFFAVVVNVALKILLMDRYAQVGLALATAAGAWINLALLTWFALRRDLVAFDGRLLRSVGKFAIAGVALAAALFFAQRPVLEAFANWGALRYVMPLLVLAALGMAVYGGAIALLFGREWLKTLRLRGARKGAPAPPPDQD